MDEKELEQKLDEMDKKVTPSFIRKRLKKAESGEISAINSPAQAEAMQGNAWKTGAFAKSRIKQIFRPCLSPCFSAEATTCSFFNNL